MSDKDGGMTFCNTARGNITVYSPILELPAGAWPGLARTAFDLGEQIEFDFGEQIDV